MVIIMNNNKQKKLINYYYSEVYEAERWHNECRLWTPMVTLSNGQHIFIDDVIDVKEWNSQLMYSGKVVKFIEVTKSMLMMS